MGRSSCRAAGAIGVGPGACGLRFRGPSNLVGSRAGRARGGGASAPSTRCSTATRSVPPTRSSCPGCERTSPEVLAQKKAEAEALFRRIGITFAVYGEGGDTERLIPFDMMPRVFTEAEWRKLERGVKQRARALNAFLFDVYHRAEIIKAGVVPADLVYRNEAYEPAVVGIDPPGGVYQPHRRHRPRAHRARGLLRARGQLPHPLGRQLHAREPRDHDADVPGAVPRQPHRAGRRLSRAAAPDAGERRAAEVRGRAGQRHPVARARSTAPTTSIRSSPTRWASSWSRGRTCSCRATSSSCAPPRGRSAST